MNYINKIILGLAVTTAVFILINMNIDEIEKGSKLRVVTTTTMITDMAKEIGGEKVEVIGLMGAGVDPHLYKATEGDVEKLMTADVIVYNGLHLEGKLTDIFEKMTESNREIVRLSDGVEGERFISSANFATSFDPHIWFDIEIWKQAGRYLAEELIRIDNANKDYYIERRDIYIGKLQEVEEYARKRIEEIPAEKRILVTAHDAFNYFGRSYDFEVLGLQGLSTASEAGVKDLQRLADYIYKKEIKAMFVETSIAKRNIEALQDAVRARGFDVKVGGELFSDALGNPGTVEGTYVGMYKHNLDTIVEGLK